MRAATSKNLSALEQALTNVNGALMAIEGARDGVATIKARVLDAQAYASANNCTIASDGSVTCIPDNPTDGPSVGTALHHQQTLKEKIETILKDAERVDSELSSALSAINSDTYTDRDGADNKVVGVPDFPQANWSPSQNAAWWRALPEERKRFLDWANIVRTPSVHPSTGSRQPFATRPTETRSTGYVGRLMATSARAPSPTPSKLPRRRKLNTGLPTDVVHCFRA